jgi:hypothetical protein
MPHDFPIVIGNERDAQPVGSAQALTMKCSVWLVCGAARKAAAVSLSMAAASRGVSLRMVMLISSAPAKALP